MSVRFIMQVSGQHPEFTSLARAFPELTARILGFIGKNASQGFYDNHLKGQDLNLRPSRLSSSGAPISRSGRRMASYSISKNLKYVSIASFPVNFFEHGRRLRSGAMEAPRRILTGKYASRLSSTLQFFAEEAKGTIYSEWETKWRKSK